MNCNFDNFDERKLWSMHEFYQSGGRLKETSKQAQDPPILQSRSKCAQKVEEWI